MLRHILFRRVFMASFLILLACSVVSLYASVADLLVGPSLLSNVLVKYGEAAKSRVEDWGTLMADDRLLDADADLIKMTHANDYFNKVEWLSDMTHWGVEDYWATPVETLATNGGDCEDFSIGKYFTLISTHVSPEKLRITYVKSLTYDQAHMVLAYYETPEAEPLILDNINKSILPASQRSDLLPIYSFSGNSIWLAKERGRKLKGDPMVSLPQWKMVNDRILDEQVKQ